MAENRRRPADEVAEVLRNRPLSEKQLAERRLPAIRLRKDTPTVEISGQTPTSDAVARLRSRDVGVVALQEPGGEPTALVVPVERYLELVGKELKNEKLEVDRGRKVLNQDALAASHVEQIDPES